MGRRDNYQQTVMEACLALGSESALARRLEVPVSKVVNWTLGNAPVPVTTFFECMNITVATRAQNIRNTQIYLGEARKRPRLRRPPR